MVKHLIGVGRAVPLILVAALAWNSRAEAAGDWEWTAGQGWVMGAGVSRPTPKEQLAYAYELEQRGEFMDSARQYFLLVQNFPESQEAGIGLQRLARCLFEMENYYTSYKAIEQVIKTYPNTGRMSDLVEIELRIAKRMMLSQTPDILAERESTNRDYNVRRALEIVNSVIDHDPYGPVAAEAYLVKGEANLFIGEINAARTAFETVRDEFPRSDYVERARLGIITCDRMVGQATDLEQREQAQIVREEEAKRRAESRQAEYDDFDNVEQSLRGIAEVEAAKMMEQAEVYRRMGTRAAVKSSEFLYKEIVRRYPGTPQAEEAMSKLGTIKIPAEQGRLVAAIKNININPFTWNKDPEPPWIVPQINPEDMVMVDSGLGPIAGVPESGLSAGTSSAGIRPAGLASASNGIDADLGYSPISAAPIGAGTPAPAFIDGASGLGEPRVYSSNVSHASPSAPPAPPGFMDLEPVRGSSFLSTNNPLPTITESDLISFGDPGTAALAAAGGSRYQPVQNSPTETHSAPTAFVPPMTPSYAAPQSSPPSLGGLDYNAPMSDLVGLAPKGAYSPTPPPSYNSGGYDTATYAALQAHTPAPQGAYDYPAQQPYSAYQDPGYYQASNGIPNQGYSTETQGGWTLGEDFR